MGAMQSRFPVLVPAAVAALAIVLVSLVQAVLTDSWSDAPSEEALAFARALQDIPRSAGDWEGEDVPGASEQERKASGAVGILSRVYRNHGTGEVVTVHLICGAARDVAIHTPDACYPGSGFRALEDPTPYRVPGGGSGGEFFTSLFMREAPSDMQRLRVFWAWNIGSGWEAPEYPRMRFGARQALNKLYLISHAPEGQSVENSSSLALADALLPAVQKSLFPPAKEKALPK